MNDVQRHPGPPDVSDDGLTGKEAAVNLGVSEATIRRMVKAGELEAEVLPRRGGQTSFRVRLRQGPLQPAPPDAMLSSERPNQPASPDPLALIREATAPLVDLNRRLLDDHQVQRDHILDLVRTNARLEAEVARLTDALARVPTPWWRRWFGPG